MRIAISGTANTGKSTLIQHFLSTWSQYKTPSKSYRDILKENKLKHSTKSTVKTQFSILDFMVNQLKTYTKDDKVIYDRCPLDNLVYSLWCNEKGVEGFDSDFIEMTAYLTRESMRDLDIIFLLKYDEAIPIVDDGVREVDVNFIQEIDALFCAMHDQYANNIQLDKFFPKDDSPAIIELPTDMNERIYLISEYVDINGDLPGEEQSIFNPENLSILEKLVEQQKAALNRDNIERELFDKFSINGKQTLSIEDEIAQLAKIKNLKK
jgi:hypothetical protein